MQYFVQCYGPNGQGQKLNPGDSLFAHGRSGGGIIFRPGKSTRVVCGNGHDSGGYCHEWCPTTGGKDAMEGDVSMCPNSWKPEDINVYLAGDTMAYQSDNSGIGRYNEFQIDGAWWNSHLPDAIEAFLVGGAAVETREKFMADYGLTDDYVPLLTTTTSPKAAFRVVQPGEHIDNGR